MQKSAIAILNVRISSLSKYKLKQQVFEFLQNKSQHQVATVNPEFLLAGLTDKVFQNVLNQTSLVIPDGIGLKFASWLQGKNLARLSGADLVPELLDYGLKHNLPVAVLNWRSGLSSAADIKQALSVKYPALRVLIQNIDKQAAPNLTALQQFSPTILFCSLGAPQQDKLIAQVLPQLPTVRLAMGCGGSFDFLTGKIRRAPKFCQALGLEWLWRVISQPQNRLRRLRRIYNAVVRFPWLAFKERF